MIDTEKIMESLITEISRKDFDLPFLADKALREKEVRDEIVKQMIHNPDIMVYYHCFYILDAASLRQPELFYPYWPKISALLDHPNSYHRDFALTLLAVLAGVDAENRFEGNERKYTSLLYDSKFMTALCCLRGLARIVRVKQDLLPGVVSLLLRHSKKTPYTEKQEALFNADVLLLLQQAYTPQTIPPAVLGFIQEQQSSISPKTRRLVQEIIGEISAV